MRRAVVLLVALTGCQAASPTKPAAEPIASIVKLQPAPAVENAAPYVARTSPAPTHGVEPAANSSSSHHEEPEDEVQDDANVGGRANGLGPTRLVDHPLASWTDARFEQAVATNLSSLGSMSFGAPSGGALVNAVQMPSGPHWELVAPAHAWGTAETVEYLALAIRRVQREFPSSHKLYIGHISAKEGGYLKPHLSHQSGRDVDISFYYVDGSAAWYARAHQKNLDVPRTWAFVKALIEETDVEMILIDHSIQRLIREHALQSGEDAAWVEQLFRGRGAERPLILHAPGHATHLHIRFYSPIAQETARRAYPHLVKHKRMTPPTSVIQHKVKKGETLGMLARKYRTTVQAIQRANGLKSTKIQAKKVYRIPRSGAAPYPVKNPLVIPARRRAPTRSAPATREQPQATRQ